MQQAGYLEEYVWTEYVGFLDASDERRLRLDKFLRWRARGFRSSGTKCAPRHS